jgi:hypothetical protein
MAESLLQRGIARHKPLHKRGRGPYVAALAGQPGQKNRVFQEAAR